MVIMGMVWLMTRTGYRAFFITGTLSIIKARTKDNKTAITKPVIASYRVIRVWSAITGKFLTSETTTWDGAGNINVGTPPSLTPASHRAVRMRPATNCGPRPLLFHAFTSLFIHRPAPRRGFSLSLSPVLADLFIHGHAFLFIVNLNDGNHPACTLLNAYLLGFFNYLKKPA